MKQLTRAVLVTVLLATAIVSSPIGLAGAWAQDDGGDQGGDDNDSGSDSNSGDDNDDDGGGSSGGSGGSSGGAGGENETENDHEYALKGVRAGRLYSLKVVLKAARARLRPGERILDINLKQRRVKPLYEVTILGQSGTLRVLRFQALRPSKTSK